MVTITIKQTRRQVSLLISHGEACKGLPQLVISVTKHRELATTIEVNITVQENLRKQGNCVTSS